MEVSEQYNDIELTDEQKAEALRIGREKEFYRRRAEAWKKSISSGLEYPKFTSGQIMQYFQLQYEVDENNQDVVNQLCHYFARETEFIGDLNKGLLLAGPIGCGKTSLMKFFCRNQEFSYRVISCRDIEKDFAENGYDCLDKYSFNVPTAVNGNPFGHQILGYCFDDLGTESNSKNYGREKNMMAEIILNRYDNRLPHNSTHITTNLTAAQITEYYGSRVTDRLKEMLNIITFKPNAKSRRK